MKGTSMPSVVSDAQNKIKRILKHTGIKIKDVANATNTPYTIANEILNVPGRLNNIMAGLVRRPFRNHNGLSLIQR